MLAEFALTPAVFDQRAHDDNQSWVDQLRELGAGMFPRTAASPVMVSNLYAGSWHAMARQIAATVDDQRARVLCLDLLKKIENTLVFRPACNQWPEEDECCWGREAIDSAREEGIERIVATRGTCDRLAAESSSLRSIEEVRDAGFWHGVCAGRDVPMQLATQTQVLRKLCLHAEFLCLVSPHIYGGQDDETDFAVELVRSALRRPHGYRKVALEIHTVGATGDSSDPDYPQRVSNRAENISARLREALAPGESVSLHLWPATAGLLDRYLLGGVFAESSDGAQKKSPRWGVGMQHIARPGDQARSRPPTRWSLLDKAGILKSFDRYFRDDVAGLLPGSPILVDA